MSEVEGCPTHLKEWRVVPAGTSSKTGKPYAEFLACPVFGCKEKPESAKQQVVREYHEDMGVPQPTKAPTKPVSTEGVDWDGKERRMVRMNVLNRGVELVLGKEITLDQLEETVDDLELLIYKK